MQTNQPIPSVEQRTQSIQTALFPSLESTLADSTDVVHTSAQRELLVPFGKFKGQSVDHLLANTDYALWLLSAKAAMLKRSHAELYAWLIRQFGAPDTTPEHNRLQNRFLHETFRMQLYLHVTRSVELNNAVQGFSAAGVLSAWKATAATRASKVYERLVSAQMFRFIPGKEENLPELRDKALGLLRSAATNIRIECPNNASAARAPASGHKTDIQGLAERVFSPVLATSAPRFEVDGADVEYVVAGEFRTQVAQEFAYWDERMRGATLTSMRVHSLLRVEVKPFMGDDYPVVLRSMVARQCNLLLVDAFEADGASWEEVRKVFASRNIRVALLEDVLVTPIPDEVRELPYPVLDTDEFIRIAEQALDEYLQGRPAPLL